tara:strand:+ start:1793 stop:4153 length:2361 start_codon:yes stop_codon:yes gene_type:complete
VSLFTIKEDCLKLLRSLAADFRLSEYDRKNINSTIDYIDKFSCDPKKYEESLSPTEDVWADFCNKYNVLIRPLPSSIYEFEKYFQSIAGFYMLSKSIVISSKSDAGMYLLDMVEGELSFLKEQLESESELAQINKGIYDTLHNGLSKYTDALSTIYLVEEADTDKFIREFLEIDTHKVTIAEISVVVYCLFYYFKDEIYESWGLNDPDTIKNIFDNLNEILQETELDTIDFSSYDSMMLSFTKGATQLNTLLTRVLQSNQNFALIIELYIILELTTSASFTDDSSTAFSCLLDYFQNKFYADKQIINQFTHSPQAIHGLFSHIHYALDDMANNGARYFTEVDINNKPLNEISLTEAQNAITMISQSCLDLILDPESEGYNTLLDDYFALSLHFSGQGIDITKRAIPLKPQNELFVLLNETIHSDASLKVKFDHINQVHPCLIDLLSIHNILNSFEIYNSSLYESQYPLLLYKEYQGILGKPENQAIFQALEFEIRSMLLTLFYYFQYLCEFCTTNAFMLRAELLGFKVNANFAQGTREYFESDDGVCQGYVHQFAEYLLVHKKGKTKDVSRAIRWNSGAEKSMFDIAYCSPYHRLAPNKRTYQFQNEPIHEICNVLQIQHATSGFRFDSGAEIAEKMLELLNDHPGDMISLGMWQSGNEVGHAAGCFIDDEQLHFFCATHSWVSIPLNAKPYEALCAFLHAIYAELPFFIQYNSFWVEIIHRTWEHKPIDDSNYYVCNSDKDSKYSASEQARESMQAHAFDFYNASRNNQGKEITDMLMLELDIES